MGDQKAQEAVSDDYSLVKVPREKRTMGWLSITNITFGIATAIFYFQMGSVMALKFGAINAIISSIYAIIVAGILGTFIAYLSAKSGMNVNLLSRGGGFGYIGASLTSFIYATNFIMYCAFEGLILVSAVHTFFPAIPAMGTILFFGTIVIPLNWFGIKQLDKLQKWSLPIFYSFSNHCHYCGLLHTFTIRRAFLDLYARRRSSRRKSFTALYRNAPWNYGSDSTSCFGLCPLP